MLYEIKPSLDADLFEDIATAFPAPAWVSDAHCECVWFNRDWLEFRGRTHAQENGRGWEDGIHPDDRYCFARVYKEHLGRRERFEVKHRLRHHTGDYRWVVLRAAPRFDRNGTFLGYIGAVTDVHEAVEIARAVDTEHDRFLNIASDILLTSDANGYITKVNAACEKVLGWTAEEIVAFPITTLIHPDDLEQTMATANILRANDELVDFENRYRHKDGTYRWLSWRAKLDPIKRQVFARAIDVTRTKAIEAELRESIDRFNLAMLATSDGVWDWNIGDDTMFFSPRCAEMLGYSAGEAPASDEELRLRIHPEDVEATRQMVDAYIRGDSSEYRAVFRMQHKDGAWRTILSRGVAQRDDNGVAYRIIGIHADITEQQRVEDNLRLAVEEAKAASKAKSEFLANMSHEIRTPMNAVIGGAHILGASAPLTDRQKKVIDVLKISADSMMELIDQLLDIGRIETRGVKLEQRPFDARILVNDVIAIVDIQAKDKGLTLKASTTCGCVSERLFLGDEARIRQILTSLCDNAVKFTERGGVEIDISCEPTRIEDVEALIFKVRDTGIGIPAAKLDAIFNTFEQGDSSIAKKYGGSGLGLAIAKSLAEAMGGVISVKSEVEKGSIFTLKLPLKRAGQRDAAVQPEPGKPGWEVAPLVLLVEDSPANVMVASHFLDDFGYRFEVAETGTEALKLIRSGKQFDLILMDVQMPGLDGRETTQMIRAFEQENRLVPNHIIAMTAYSMTADREKCLAAGMDDYLSKPFDPELLRTKLCDGARKRSGTILPA